MKNGCCLVLVVVWASVSATPASGEVLSLAGPWRFGLDSHGAGENEQWFAKALTHSVRLPGSTDANGFGTRNTRPRSYDHLSRIHEYVGPAWYQREVDIPQSWANKHIELFLERCHWQTKVWVDEHYAGMQDSLCVPHQFDLSRLLTAGRHRLTICVDNTPKHFLGPFASSISEETQTNWNGIVGRIELQARDPVWIAGAQVYPDISQKQAEVRLRIANQTATHVTGELTLQVAGTGIADAASRAQAFRADDAETTWSVRLPMGESVSLWNEFSPVLYRLRILLRGSGPRGHYTDACETTFGMRELTVRDRQLVLNGDTLFLRGTLECCVFPLTGYPPTDEAAWQRIFAVCTAHGLNHMRFHSWCPPEAAFAAADKAGIFIQAEAPRANVDTNPLRDQFIQEESLRMLDAYGNHPSFALLSTGNELSVSEDVLSSLLATLQTHDSRRLYTASTGLGPQIARDQFRVRHEGRGVGGPGTERDLREQVAQVPVPLIAHEIGQWAVYPALDEIAKYTGWLKPRNFELVRDDLASKHMLDQAAAFTTATAKHAALLYKEEIEVLLRTPGLAGFQLLGLHDYPGTGMALVGLLDAFWDSKDAIAPAEFRQFCNETVPLLRMAKREYVSREPFTATAEICHYGKSPIQQAEPIWTLEDESGQLVAAGAFSTMAIPRAARTVLGTISAGLPDARRANRMKVTVCLKGTAIANSWNIWVYPADVNLDVPEHVMVSHTWNDQVSAALEEGKSVLLLPARGHLRNTFPGRFLPVFWSPVYFPHTNVTMSILCEPTHPALAQFPTDSHSDWQWWDLLQQSRAVILDDLPEDFRPIVQVVDNFSRNHRLGNLFEAKVGRGKLLFCSIDIDQDLDKRPAARQLRHSLLEYMKSPSFSPARTLDVTTLEGMFRTPPALLSLGAKVTRVDSEDIASGNVAANAIDGDPNSFWCTQWVGEAPAFPHEMVVDLGTENSLAGFRLLPRQDGNTNGWFERIAIYVSNDPTHWGEPVARAALPVTADEKTVPFDTPRTGRYIRVVVTDGLAGNPWAAIAELDVIPVK
jgi:hypothetical protein